MNLNVSPVLQISCLAPERTEHFVLGKLTEEIGEFARAVNQPERCDEPLVGEAADIMICVMDALFLNYRNDPAYSSITDADVARIVVDDLNKTVFNKAGKWAGKVLMK